jgi:hypothetical protein
MKHKTSKTESEQKPEQVLHAPCFMLHGGRGQFLIEAIVAGSILITGFTGILALLSQSLHLNRVVTDNYVGTYLAAEGIEVVKNIIDHNVMKIVGCTDPDLCSSVIAPCGSCRWDAGLSGGPREVDYESTTLAPAGGGRKLKFDSTTGLYGYGSGVDTPYERVVRINRNPQPDNNPDEIEVVSTVTWSTGMLSSQTELIDRFFDWRP